jgi:hypothetical protein
MTPLAEQEVVAPKEDGSRLDRLEKMFRLNPDTWIPVYEVQRIAGFQYNARISDLRHKRNMDIPEPREERVNGQLHTWYMFRTIVRDNSGQNSFAYAVDTHSSIGRVVERKENASILQEVA